MHCFPEQNVYRNAIILSKIKVSSSKYFVKLTIKLFTIKFRAE